LKVITTLQKICSTTPAMLTMKRSSLKPFNVNPYNETNE
jgi:hypothetical protein